MGTGQIAAGLDLHGKTILLQARTNELGNLRLIFDDENAHGQETRLDAAHAIRNENDIPHRP